MATHPPDHSTQTYVPDSDPRAVQERFRGDRWGHPEQIGPYRIGKVLGEGGMGVVYLAEQSDPIRRTVALKIIKLGMDTKRVMDRFDAERQALALMNHPNVARVLDAGSTETGRPYFVMEYVQGIPITAYCDSRRLTAEQRLQLFMDVCHAVQHAHQKGIIHRDLKPSNVLVGEIDGKAAVRVIDFGIAKAIEQKLSENTLFTEQGQVIGTPAYMSPEQAGGDPADIDTRTDVYALGVLLYELLVGAPPFDPRTLAKASISELQRVIREVDPLRPSTRVGSLGPDATTVAERRRTDPRTLVRALRGELDWIVMKCLEKDRSRRYETANGVAMEIVRYLANEPVLAGPPSTSYRLRKFVRRNRGAVAAGMLVALTLLAGLVSTSLMFLRAERAREDAVVARDETAVQRDVAEQQRIRAEREATLARQTADFLVNIFEVSDPNEAGGNSVTAREILDRAASGLGGQSLDNPSIRAALLNTLARVYRNLGSLEQARELGESALTLARTLSPSESVLQLSAQYDLAVILASIGEYEQAESLQKEVLEKRVAAHGGDSVPAAESQYQLARVFRYTGRYEEAERLCRESMATLRSALGSQNATVASILVDLGAILENRTKYEEAERCYREALAIHRQVRGERHLDVALDLHYLAFLKIQTENLVEAEALLNDALGVYRRVLPPDHPYIASALNNLAAILHDRHRFADALAAYREALAMHRRLLPEKHTTIAGDLTGIAAVLRDNGDLDASIETYRQALEMRRALLGPRHASIGTTLSGMGECQTRRGEYTAAEASLLEAHSIFSEALSSESPMFQENLRRLERLYLASDRKEEAERWSAMLSDDAE